MAWLGHAQRVLGSSGGGSSDLLCSIPCEAVEEVVQYLVAKALAGQHTHITALKLYIADNKGPSEVEALLNIDKKRVAGFKSRVWDRLWTVKESLRWQVAGEIIKRSYQSVMGIDPIMIKEEPYPVSLYECKICGTKVATPLQHVVMKHRDLVRRLAREIVRTMLSNCWSEGVSC